jgi:hypothetical protein
MRKRKYLGALLRTGLCVFACAGLWSCAPFDSAGNAPQESAPRTPLSQAQDDPYAYVSQCFGNMINTTATAQMRYTVDEVQSANALVNAFAGSYIKRAEDGLGQEQTAAWDLLQNDFPFLAASVAPPLWENLQVQDAYAALLDEKYATLVQEIADGQHPDLADANEKKLRAYAEESLSATEKEAVTGLYVFTATAKDLAALLKDDNLTALEAELAKNKNFIKATTPKKEPTAYTIYGTADKQTDRLTLLRVTESGDVRFNITGVGAISSLGTVAMTANMTKTVTFSDFTT